MPGSPIASAALLPRNGHECDWISPRWSCNVPGARCLVRPGQFPQHSCTVSQRWRHDIAVDVIKNLGRLDVAIEELLNLHPHEGKEFFFNDPATTENDALG